MGSPRKARPIAASKGALPPYRAQLATLVQEAPSGSEWIHELKYDGYRIGCLIHAPEVRLESRRGNDWTSSFPELVEAARHVPARLAVLDGEVAIVAPSGKTSFQALQNAFAGGGRAGLSYFAFDLLHLDGRDISKLPLDARKAELRSVLQSLPADSIIRYSDHFEEDGALILRRACEIGAEGIVSKRRDLPYRPGRNAGWLKAKCIQRQEFVIGGFTDPEGSRQGIGSVLVGYYEGDELRFASKVGTGLGFTAQYLSKLRQLLESIEQKQSPFTPRPPGWLGRNAHWVQPVLVAEVAFTEWTDDAGIRHPSLQGFRQDKRAQEVVRESPHRAALPVGNVEASVSRNGASPGRPRPGAMVVRGTAITSPERVVYPAFGFTKLDLAHFYDDVAERMLPHVRGRPLTLVRCERGVTKADGLRTECSFLHHSEGWHRWAPPSVRRVRIREQKKTGEYLVVDSAEALVALVQGDIVEIHVWNTTTDHIEQPDRMIFDLDPAPDVTWSALLDGARALRKRLESVGLKSWPRLTGGKGLHVVVPLQPELGWDAVYEYSHVVADSMARDAPSTFTTVFSKKMRAAKILVDYKRNHRAATAIASYSTRARPNGSVAIPLSWAELNATPRSDLFTVTSVKERLQAKKRDPWRGFWTCRQNLTARTGHGR
jgi:bifunctional non-homologous end joining protein LigD